MTIGANVTEIAESAFDGIKTLATVTFGGNETTIGNNAFRGTIISALTLPSKLVTIGDGAFTAAAGKYPTFSSVTIPATVQTIGVAAFEGCENLSTVTLAADSWLRTINISAFAYTSLTELDLSNATKWKTGNTVKGMESFGTDGAAYGPFTSATHAKTSLITSVTLPTTCVTIYDAAFKNVQYLNNIDLSKVKTIEATAFEGCANLTEVAIGTGAGANNITIGANAFSGCVKLATVELGQIGAATIDADAFAGVDGNADHDFDDDGEYYPAGIETLKFNTISAALTTKPFVNILTIEEVHFQKYLNGDAIIPTAYFDVNAAGAMLTNIYYNANTVTVPAAPKQGFAVDAFSANVGDDRVATLTTKLAQFTSATGFNTNATLLNGVTIEAGYSSTFKIGYLAEGAAESTRKMLKDKNSSSYYYYFNNNTGGVVSIEKINGENGADVAVYQAYTDVANNALNIYFMPSAVADGVYGIANGQLVIIKSNKEDAVEAIPDGISTMVGIGGGILNELQITDAAYSKLGVMSNAALLNNGANDVWFFNHPTNSGFGFTKYNSANQNGLAANCVYLQTDVVAADRVNMVWLDENGNTTAIETIETKAETLNNGVMYNVAGQKVGADYKGMVIMNGKKFIQK